MNKIWVLPCALAFLSFFTLPVFSQQNTLSEVLGVKKTDSTSTYNLLYQTRLRSKTVAAVSEIYTPELLKNTSPSFGGLLTGRLAGLYTNQTTGEPGNDDVSVYVRGQAPFVLIDGTPQSFVSINPEQIESVTLLKDALSTAMLGMRGGNNAILITTKKGIRDGQKIEFTANYGLQSPSRLPTFLHSYDYARLYNEALSNEGKAPAYSQADLDAYQNNTDPYGHPDVDWQKQILRKTTPYSRYDLAISGGKNNARYFVNLDYLNQDGLFKTEDFNVYNTNANYKRYIFRSNLEMDLSKYITTSLNLFGRIQQTNQPGVTTATVFSNLRNTPNNAYPVRNADSSLGGSLDYQSNIYAQTVRSGYQPIYERDFKADLSFRASLDPFVTGLWVKVLAALNGYQRETINRSRTFAVFRQSTVSGANSYSQYGVVGDQSNSTTINSQNRLFYTEASAGYDKSIGKNNLNALAVVSNDYRMTNSDLPFNFSSVSAKLSYDYDGKYLAEVAMGYNGTERYPASKRYGFFPAFGLGWNITKEDYFKNNVSWLNNLKLRASYGKSGNANIGYYEYNQYYTTGNGYGFGNTVPTSNVTLQQDVLANPAITWEKSDKFSAGIDAAFFNNRLSFSIDYFNDKYYDLIQQRSNGSDIFGTSYIRENIGSNRYSGLEVQATWQVSRGSFSYFVSPNFTLQKSRVLQTAEPNWVYDYLMRTGRPVGQSFGYVAEGLFNSVAEINSHAFQGASILPGDIKYKDLNGDGKIDSYDQTAIGSTSPMMYYGLNTGVSVKGVDVTVLVQGVANRNVQLSGNSVWAFQNGGRGQAYEEQLNRWTPENKDGATYPRLWIGNNSNNTLTSTYWVRKGDYLRIKNVEIGYSLPASLIKRARLNVARIFLNATNLLTFSSLKNYDPESYTGLYPVMRVINAGLNIKF